MDDQVSMGSVRSMEANTCPRLTPTANESAPRLRFVRTKSQLILALIDAAAHMSRATRGLLGFLDQFSVLVSYPAALNKICEELYVFLIGDAATSDDYKDEREAILQMWDDLNREDLGALELL